MRLVFIADAADAARVLEEDACEELRARGVTEKLVERARGEVSAEIGCAPGTLENLRRKRLKKVDQWLHAQLQRVLLSKIERELRRLNHEYETARQIIDATVGLETCSDGGLVLRDRSFASLEKAIARAQKLRSALRCGRSSSQQASLLAPSASPQAL